MDDSPPESCHAPAELLSPAVGLDNGRQVPESVTVVSGAERVLQELVASMSPSRVYSPPLRHGEAFLFFISVALASTAAAADSDIQNAVFIHQGSPVGESVREMHPTPLFFVCAVSP